MTRTNNQIVTSILRTVIEILDDDTTPLTTTIAVAPADDDDELRAAEHRYAVAGHTLPHFNNAGGCKCQCTLCTTYPEVGRPYGRCICPGCSQDCPTEKLEFPGYIPPPEQPTRYDMPGPPPIGRTVRQTAKPDIIHEADDQHPEPWTTPAPRDERAWERIDTTSDVPYFLIVGGVNEHGQHVTPIPWINLLDQLGPLELVPLSDQDLADELLYGPVGGRWGNPDEPCPVPTCRYGLNHIGRHLDLAGYEVVVLPRDIPEGAYCTCGRPSAHHPTCDRYPNQTAENSDG